VEYEFKAALYPSIERDGVKASLYIHPEQSEGFDFHFSFKEMLDQIVDWYSVPSTKELDADGMEELKMVRQTLQKYADATQEMIDFYTKEK
jgi:hypothetical protein